LKQNKNATKSNCIYLNQVDGLLKVTGRDAWY